MVKSQEPDLKRFMRGCSRVLMFVGAVIFFFGGKLLYEIKHVDFVVSEVTGIFGGVLLMLLGAGIAIPSKSRKP